MPATGGKQKRVEEIEASLSGATSVIFVNHTGFKAMPEWRLRGIARAGGGQYRVLKNTLLRKALSRTHPQLSLPNLTQGPTAALFSFDDPLKLLKPLMSFIQDNEGIPVVKGAILENTWMPTDELKSLTRFESRHAIVASCYETMLMPLQSAYISLLSPITTLVTTLEALIQKKKKQEGGYQE